MNKMLRGTTGVREAADGGDLRVQAIDRVLQDLDCLARYGAALESRQGELCGREPGKAEVLQLDIHRFGLPERQDDPVTDTRMV